ncbi:hypothetical protein JHK86_010560 [Glycine max]|nr:hypothetical protein JHK86_010560 [Glycine max]
MVSFVDCRGDGVEFMNVIGSFLKVRTKRPCYNMQWGADFEEEQHPKLCLKRLFPQ